MTPSRDGVIPAVRIHTPVDAHEQGCIGTVLAALERSATNRSTTTPIRPARTGPRSGQQPLDFLAAKNISTDGEQHTKPIALEFYSPKTSHTN